MTLPEGDGAAGDATMPQQVRISSIALYVVAAFLLLLAGLYLFGRERLADGVLASLRDAGKTLPARDDLIRGNTIVAGVDAVAGVLAAVAGASVRRHRRWARFLGIGLGALFGVFGLQSVALGGATVAVGALQLVAGVVVVAGLASRPAAEWVDVRGS